MKLFIVILSAVTAYLFIDSVFVSDESQSAGEYITIDSIWDTYIPEADKAILCNAYWTQPYEQVIPIIGSTVNFSIGDNTKEALYVVMNEECY